MSWTPSPEEEREYRALVTWVAGQPEGTTGARILCPRGHLIAHLGISAGPAGLMVHPKLRGGHGKAILPEHKGGYVADGVNPTGLLKSQLRCQQKGCGYRGTRLQARLARDIARENARGRHELRLRD